MNDRQLSNDSQPILTGHLDGTPGCEGVIGKGKCKPKDDEAIREDGKKRRYGYIYLIRCLVNGKVYIGQTVKTVAKRWRDHVTIGRYKPDNLINPIDLAIRKYGEDSFEVETLETVYEEYLGTRERYWIQQYDCCTLNGYDKGYNASRGGEPNRRYIFDEDDLIKTYQMGCSLPWMMCVLQIRSTEPIRNVLVKRGIAIRNISAYNVSDLPDCIIDAYCHNTGKTTVTRSHRSHRKTPPTTTAGMDEISARIRHSRALDTTHITVAQFDTLGTFIRNMHSYGEVAHWVLESGMTTVSDYDKAVRYVVRQLPSETYVVSKMFKHYWIMLDRNESLPSSETLARCQALIREYVLARERYDLVSFDKNLDRIMIDIVNTSIRQVAFEWGIGDNALKKRLRNRGLPYRTLDIFRYAVDHNLIDDPVGDAKEAIYETFCETNNMEETIAICQCSQEHVYFACKYHGLSPYAIDNMRSKKPKIPVRPINMYAKDGTYLGTFANMTEAGRHAGISGTSVGRSCRHKSLQVPYYFRFADEDELDDE